jgi:hypothetical protein
VFYGKEKVNTPMQAPPYNLHLHLLKKISIHPFIHFQLLIMKTAALLITTFCVFTTLQSDAKIWRVNNMPGVTANFTTAQAAHDGASAGDTIHLEPSVNSYGYVTTTKKLTWLSIGYFLTENPGNQFSTAYGSIMGINLNAGSDGSVVSVITAGTINIYAPNVSVTRSVFNMLGIDVLAVNTIVSRCFITNYVNINSTDVIISNNIVGTGITMVNAGNSAIITNNVLNYSIRNEQYFGPSNIYNSVFQNNISVKGGIINFSNSQATYNMSPDASFPAGNNNFLNTNMANVFINPTGGRDLDYVLKPGSPAIGVGNGGIDLGAFNGAASYVLGLQPAIPAITALSAPSANNSSTINVTFSAKSNN